jgi:hypothetical protein
MQLWKVDHLLSENRGLAHSPHADKLCLQLTTGPAGAARDAGGLVGAGPVVSGMHGADLESRLAGDGTYEQS